MCFNDDNPLSLWYLVSTTFILNKLITWENFIRTLERKHPLYINILTSEKVQYLKKLQMPRRIISRQDIVVVMAILRRECNLNPSTNCIQASRSTIFKNCNERTTNKLDYWEMTNNLFISRIKRLNNTTAEK